MAFRHFGRGGHGGLKGERIFSELARQGHHNKDGHGAAEFGFINHGPVTFNDAGALQLLNPAQTGRGRQTDPFGQIHIADLAVASKLGQYSLIHAVNIRHILRILRTGADFSKEIERKLRYYCAMEDIFGFRNAKIATLAGERGYGLTDGCIIWAEGEIAHIGKEIPARFRDAEIIDLEGRLVTPGLIDCHTHLVYAGSRAEEFEMRLEGKSYEDIAKAGGGIVNTVAATRAASEETLLKQSLKRVDNLLAEGVTTIEIKSGYGLDEQSEHKMLRTARELEHHRLVNIQTTYLGAHALPQGLSADDYIDQVCIPALRSAHKDHLVDAVDGFCETIGFTPAQITRVFDAARELDLPVKLHAEQLSDQGGAQLAARYGALSADHLEYISDAGIAAMAEAGVVAGILPGAFYFLGETQKPPIEKLRAAGVPMAVATDCNPGSSPMTSLLLAMNMAATLFALTPEECLRGVTVNGARALGLTDCGRLAPGLRADLAVWDTDHPAELTYRMGDTPLHARVFGGLLC